MSGLNENIQLRSEEAQEILGDIPHWIIRWGITVLAGGMFIILICSWFIKYPDIISTQIAITSKEPLAKIELYASGILHLFFDDGAYVDTGSDLGYIQSSAEYKDVQIAKKKTQELLRAKSFEEATILKGIIRDHKNLSLGSLDIYYEEVLKNIDSYLFFNEVNPHRERMLLKKSMIDNYELLNQKLENQKKLLKREVELSQNRLPTDSSSTKKRLRLEDVEISILKNYSIIKNLKDSILDQEFAYLEHKKRILNSLEENLRIFHGQLLNWEQTFVLKSPYSGVVSYMSFQKDKEYAEIGEEVLTILPYSGEVFGIVQIPAVEKNKIKKDQLVNINLVNYPVEEYGVIKGRIEQVSLVSKNNMYTVTVSLPYGLVTSYGKNLDFNPEIRGTAEIFIDDTRLLERIFHQFKSILNVSA